MMGVLDAMSSSNLKPENEAEEQADRVYRTTYMFSATMPQARSYPAPLSQSPSHLPAPSRLLIPVIDNPEAHLGNAAVPGMVL